jgi:hypothetical protein
MRWMLMLLCAVSLQAATNGPVRELGLYTKYSESAEWFDTTVNIASLTNGVGAFLKASVDAAAERAAKAGKSPQSIASMRGRWLEWATLIALRERKLTPAYWQAEFAAVPHNFNDALLWSKEHGPIIISCKTSLRERYKQADLEAVALRQHYPDARFFIMTIDADKRHLANIRKKIAGKELLALHAIHDETNADELFAWLKTLTLTDAPDKTLRTGKPVR